MCGIAGILNLKSSKTLNKPIKTMTDALAHRGPDADGFYIEENKIALGHRRLSIIDLSTNANQPFRDSTGRYTLIFNGEIYNYQEIKPLIPEYQFKTTSDTEVILAAYIKWGKDCLAHFNGMFAFALWDKIEKTLFVARDRMGVKPLYYHIDAEQFIFSSEIRSLLSSGLVSRRIDRMALRDYLVFQSVYAPYTLIQNVFQIMPGEYAFISEKGIDKSTYWQVENPPKIEVPDIETARENVKELLSASIKRRMISDVPLGAFLSGGIDSSATVALMAELSERPVDTFTVIFDEEHYDESKFAQIVAKKFNTHHTEIHLQPNDFLKELPQALDVVDAPSGDGLNTYIVSKATKNAGVTVALSGLGSDELFAGYPYFQHYQKINQVFSYTKYIPNAVKRPLISIAKRAYIENQKMGRALNILNASKPTIDEIYPHFRLINTEGEANKLLTHNGLGKSNFQGLLNDKILLINQLPLLSQVAVAELLGYTLNVLLKDTDQYSMASALEIREPFFDYKLVEYVLNVPDKFKLDDTSPKSLLVSSMGSLLPKEIVNRPKMGFSFPWKHWLLNELRSFCQSHLENLSKYDCFNYEAINDEWHLFLSSKGEKCSWVKIWQLVMLSHWILINNIEC